VISTAASRLVTNYDHYRLFRLLERLRRSPSTSTRGGKCNSRSPFQAASIFEPFVNEKLASRRVMTYRWASCQREAHGCARRARTSAAMARAPTAMARSSAWKSGE
jgi:hypothetical protein